MYYHLHNTHTIYVIMNYLITDIKKAGIYQYRYLYFFKLYLDYFS